MDPSPVSDRPHLPWGPRLTARERMTLAKLSGAIDLWTVDKYADRSEEERRTALLGYSSSPAVWGVLLGRALRRVELGEGAYEDQVGFCRLVGADEDVARTHLAWLRDQPGL